MFYVCNYLDIGSLSKVKKEYVRRLSDTYDRIKGWREMAKQHLSKEVCDEFTKYLIAPCSCD